MLVPPNILRVHTEYVLVKSVGPKVLWAEITSAGDWRIFPFPSVPCLNCRGGVTIYCPFGNFSELNRAVTCMVLKAKADSRLTSIPLPQ
ncbi:hypothetical protein TNCV_3133511 [Trichonephila clavipes]|nr:hypothetical protein TNCV_3133511 [Trichonephila clavipes]